MEFKPHARPFHTAVDCFIIYLGTHPLLSTDLRAFKLFCLLLSLQLQTFELINTYCKNPEPFLLFSLSCGQIPHIGRVYIFFKKLFIFLFSHFGIQKVTWSP